MNDLIERLKKATGPDRELDAEIHWAVGLGRRAYWNASAGLPRPLPDNWANLPKGLGRKGVEVSAPHYTGSVDAAMTLFPPGWVVCGDLIMPNDDYVCEAWNNQMGKNSIEVTSHGYTAPTSLSSAALKAREHEKTAPDPKAEGGV